MTGLREGPEPPRSCKNLWCQLQNGLQVNLVGNPGAAPVASVREGRVKGEDQALRARVLSSLHSLDHRVAISRPVHLKEHLIVDGADVFDRAAGERAEPHGDAATRRRFGDGDFAFGMNGLHARGRNDDRHRHRLTHNRGGHRALVGETGDVRRETQLVERRQVVTRGESLLRPRDQCRVDRLREAFLGATLRYRHGLEPRTCHLSPVTAHCETTGGVCAHHRYYRAKSVTGTLLEWSGDESGRIDTRLAARAVSPCPKTHSGSGSDISRPVKNFAAMQPPRHASYEPHDAHAPGLPGSRRDRKSSLFVHTDPKPASRTFPARNSSWMTNGQAYTSPTGSMRQTTRPAPQRLSPSRGLPRAER